MKLLRALVLSHQGGTDDGSALGTPRFSGSRSDRVYVALSSRRRIRTGSFELLDDLQGSLYYMYWTYENWVHNYARVHGAECAHCNDGQGSHNAVESRAGRWLGPFDEFGQAFIASKFETKPCGHCSPR